MPRVAQIFWRAVTKADFFNVERGADAGPRTGGGQLYFSVSFGNHLDHAALGAFLGVEPPEAIATTRPARTIHAAVLDEPSVVAPLEFRSRYRPPKPDDRYYIARQNRRRPNGQRHPAWRPERGFPAAPADLSGPDDPAIPDLSRLKICILRDEEGAYHAAFVNRSGRPATLPATADALFAANAGDAPNGLIDLRDAHTDLEDWRVALRDGETPSPARPPTAPEVEDAADAVARATGARGRWTQGFRQSAEERRAIELRAMAVARDRLERDGWDVDDVSATRSYDLHCRRGGEVLHAEVKGTVGDGSAVLLTPNEVAVARAQHPETALMVVSGIVLGRDGHHAVATGGQLSVRSPWHPDEAGELMPLGFRYVLADPATR